MGVTVHSLRSSPHELRFTAELGDEAHEIFVRSSLPDPPGADVAVVLTLLPAMVRGGSLQVEAPVDETLVRRIPEIQAVLRAFKLAGDWTPAEPLGNPVELICPVASPPVRRADRRIATFFSAGLDSFAALLRNPEITDLIYIAGMDAPVGEGFEDHHARARGAVSRIAEQVDKPLITLETNARDLYGGLVGPLFGGEILAAGARAVAAEISRLYVASSQCYRWLLENSSHPMLDPLWGRGALEVIHEGAELSRAEKLEAIAGNELVRATLRVCWEGTGSHYNCCRCEKCLRTMVALEALGVLDEFETFPEPLDLELVATTPPVVRHELAYWIENLELAVRRDASAELVRAVEACIAAAPPGGPPTPRRSPLANPTAAGERMLYLNPAATASLERKRGVAFLIGAYDGGGDYEGLTQLRAAVELLDPLADDLLALVVVELDRLAEHRDRGQAVIGLGAEHELAFDHRGEAAEEAAAELGLIPAVLPAGLEHAVTYLYGGAYLDPGRGTARLRMAEAAAALARRAAVPSRRSVSSGLELELDWARGAGVRYRSLLGGLDKIRVRDPLSLYAAAHLADADGAPAASLCGDDAVGPLARVAQAEAAPGREDGELLRLNVELPDGRREHGRLGFLGDFLAAAADTSDSPIELQIVIADGAPGKRPPTGPLIQALNAAGVPRPVAEPLVLSPERMDVQATALRRADLTVALSQPVALASLMLGVPAALVRADDRDTQRADALRRDFALPDELLLAADADPREQASRITALIAEHGASDALRKHLLEAAERAARRRSATEAELLEALADGADERPPRAGGPPPDEDYRRLLRVHRRTVARLEESERLARERELRLTELGDSASWRWTAPLRRASHALRRLRRRP
jgi:hypothetical protein